MLSERAEQLRRQGLPVTSGDLTVPAPVPAIDEEPKRPSRPAGSAAKDEWVLYAVGLGMHRRAATETTKSELAEITQLIEDDDAVVDDDGYVVYGDEDVDEPDADDDAS